MTVIQHDLSHNVVHVLEPGKPAQRSKTKYRGRLISDLLHELNRGVPRSKILYLCRKRAVSPPTRPRYNAQRC